MSKIDKQRPRLGRGLSSLISVSDLPVEAEIAAPPARDRAPHDPVTPVGQPAAASATPPPLPGPVEIPLNQIAPNPHQPRREFHDASLAELAASIRSTGLIQPIIVRPTDGGYQLIAGERRLRAAKLAGLSAIPAIFREVDSFTQAQMALIENIQREDLNPIDRAEAYKTLLTQLGLTQAELATRLGEERSSVANYLRLLDLSEPVRQMLKDGRLTVGHAKLLAGVADILEQQRLANLVLSQELSVRNLEKLIQAGGAGKSPAAKAPPSAHLQDLEQSMARQLGMKVQIRTGGKKTRGRIVIHYASLDQFDDLMSRLGVRGDEG